MFPIAQIPFPQIFRQKSLNDLRNAMSQPEATPDEVDDIHPAWRTNDAIFGALPTLLLALTGHGQDAAEYAQGYLGGKINKAQNDTATARRKAATAAHQKNAARQRAIELAQLNYGIADADYNRWQNKQDLDAERRRQKQEADENKPKPDPYETDDALLDDFLNKASQGGKYTPEDVLLQLQLSGRISPDRYKQYLGKLEQRSPLHGLDAPTRKRADTYVGQGIPAQRAGQYAQKTSFMNDAGSQAIASALDELDRLRQQYPDLAAGAYENVDPSVLRAYDYALRRAQGIVQAQAAPFHAAEQEWARQLSASVMNPARLGVLLTQRPVVNPAVKRYQDLYNEFHSQIGKLPKARRI